MSPSRTSAIDGGMIWPRVPVAQMSPVASFGSYPARNIEGSARTPIVTTVAPTIPVLAAKSAPTMMTAMPNPPVRLPKAFAIAVSSSSAILARSSVTPIKINKGTATSVSLVMVPKIRPDKAATKLASKWPAMTPNEAKSNAVPPKVSATGKPKSSRTQTLAKRASANSPSITCGHLAQVN